MRFIKCLIVILLSCNVVAQNLSIGLFGGAMYSDTYWDKKNSFCPIVGANINFNYKFLVSDINFNYIDFKHQGNLYELSSAIGLSTSNIKTIFFDLRAGALMIRSSDLPYELSQQNIFPIFYNQIQPIIKSNLNYRFKKSLPLFIKLGFEYNLIEYLLDEKHLSRLGSLKFTLGINYLIIKVKTKEEQMTSP